MDGAFRRIAMEFGLGLIDAAALCSATPAQQLGLAGFGVLAVGGVADLVVLDSQMRVARTFIAGNEVYVAGVRS